MGYEGCIAIVYELYGACAAFCGVLQGSRRASQGLYMDFGGVF